MARHETDREDLLAEATALVRRAELQIDDEPEPVVAGVKSNGCWSIYFGGDPVYHFDVEGRLRRAFVENRLYRTLGSTLARMQRERTESTTTLQRHDLEPDELDAFLTTMKRRLKTLAESIEAEQADVLRGVPAHDDLQPDLLQFIQRVHDSTDPLAPAFKGKR